ALVSFFIRAQDSRHARGTLNAAPAGALVSMCWIVHLVTAIDKPFVLHRPVTVGYAHLIVMAGGSGEAEPDANGNRVIQIVILPKRSPTRSCCRWSPPPFCTIPGDSVIGGVANTLRFANQFTR